MALYPGNTHDSQTIEPLLAPGIGTLVADKAYGGRPIRSALESRGIEPVIPAKSNAKNPPPLDTDAYRSRHLVENAFADLKQFRGVATRYCKLATTFMSFVLLTAWVVNTRATRRGPSPYS